MKINKKIFYGLIVVAFFFAGCAAPQVNQTRTRIFFPPLPDKPRIEFKGTYSSQHSFPKTSMQRFKDSILGPDPSFVFGRPIDTASCGNGKVYISDTLQDRVFVYDFNKYTVTYLTEGGSFQNPTGLATDEDCNLYVVNTMKKKVLVYDKDGKPYFSFGGSSILEWPTGVAVDTARGHIYVSDVKKHDVFAFDMKGKLLFSFLEKADRGNPIDGGFNYPMAIDVASDGRVAVIDFMNARVKVYDSNGEFLLAFGERGDSITSFGMIKGMAIDNDDNVYVTDAETNMIKVFNLEGTALTTFGGKYKSVQSGMGAAAGFFLISGIDADPKGGIFIADQFNKTFQVFQYLDDAYLKEHPIQVYDPKQKTGKGWEEEIKEN